MPHVDGFSLPLFRSRDESRFAAPVAAITRFVANSLADVRTASARWQARRSGQALLAAYRRAPAPKADDAFADAHDHHDLERMQRDWDRREAGGVRDWEWR